MAFGSDTYTHELLARLAAARQNEELRHSREILRSRLSVTTDALAYPVGSRTSFSDATKDALKTAGYRIAFSY
jgi:peptidoglycan/xylan/chitin deacetylase (PgdA/CDA1 family)